MCWILLGFTLGAQAAPPQQNLWVELRWTQSRLSAAALRGVLDGAAVVGTAGSVAPQLGVTARTSRPNEAAETPQRLLVLNGLSARVQWAEQQTLQWVEAAVDLPLERPGPSANSGARVIAAPRSTTVQTPHGFAIRPQWPGGKQPVRVEFQSFGAAEVFSTVSVPLDHWVTVARSGADVRAPAPGVVSSRDAQGIPGRDLQLRISLAP